jgi:phage terminase large subunit-like protein
MQLEGLGSSKFFQEFLNEPVDDATRKFKWAWLQQTWEEMPANLSTYICIDVADSLNAGSDYTGVVVVSVDDRRRWYVRHVKRYQITTKQLVDLIFELWNTWHPRRIGIEKKAFEFQIKPFLDDRSEAIGVYPQVIELKPSGQNKENRIVGALEGLFEAKKIFFNPHPQDDTELLRGELYDFPSAKHDDLCDALSYVQDFGVRPLEIRRAQPILQRQRTSKAVGY